MGEIITFAELSRKISVSLQRYLSRGEPTDDIQRGVIEDAILAAEGKAKAALGIKHILPMDKADESASLKLAISWIAIYILWSDHDDAAVPEKIKDNYNDAMSYFKDLKSNDTTLGLDDTDEAAERKDINITFSRG